MNAVRNVGIVPGIRRPVFLSGAAILGAVAPGLSTFRSVPLAWFLSLLACYSFACREL